MAPNNVAAHVEPLREASDARTNKRRALGLEGKGVENQEGSLKQGIPAVRSPESLALESASRIPGQQSSSGASPFTSSAIGLTTSDIPITDAPSTTPLASSYIFERDVQEPNPSMDAGPAIPAHIKTEDMIPPALEASSLAITDDHLQPDDVEIVTHAAHQPAATVLPDSISIGPQSDSHLSLTSQQSPSETLPAQLVHQESDETASNYGALDPNDVRRVSFISFADVVQAEHAGPESRDGLHQPTKRLNSRRGSAQSPRKYRSPSPSSTLQSSPRSQTESSAAIDQMSHQSAGLSPVRKPSHVHLDSQGIAGGTQQGELLLETMSQALRKTTAGDLSSPWSHPASATSVDDRSPDRSLAR